MNKFLASAAFAALLICGQANAMSICDNANGNPANCVIPNGDGGIPIGGYSKVNITTGTTTLVKTGKGVLHVVGLNTYVASATIKFYDGITAVNIFATMTLPSTITGVTPDALEFDLPFTNGLTIVTSGATDITVVYK